MAAATAYYRGVVGGGGGSGNSTRTTGLSDGTGQGGGGRMISKPPHGGLGYGRMVMGGGWRENQQYNRPYKISNSTRTVFILLPDDS